LSSKIPKIGSNGGYPDSRSASISPELLGLVKRTAIHLKGRLPSNVDLDDLIQSGLEGLIQAIDSFDESRNTSLEQYSKTRIRGAMLDDVRRMSQTTRTMADAITDKTRIVFVTNPNNPTGTWLTKTEISEFLQKVPANVIVLLDEAYFEYVDEADYPNGIDYLAQYPNLVITRTFSKAYGLASLRVGYGISQPDIADLMNRVRPPFNVNSMALAAAVATLSDDDYVAASKKLNDDGLKYLTTEFDRLGLPYIPSVGNFISFEIPAGKNISAADVNQKLLQAGVIVRPVANYEMPNHLRVSVGIEAENKAFIEALNKILG